MLTVVSAVGSMLGWWSTWKGFHLAGVLALLAVWLYIRKHDQTSEMLDFVAEKKVLLWLGVSVIMCLASLMHRAWNPIWALGFGLSAVAATITIVDGGEVVEGILSWVFFNKEHPWRSALIDSVSIAVLVFIIYEYCRLNGIEISPEFSSICATIILFCIAVCGASVWMLVWGKKTS